MNEDAQGRARRLLPMPDLPFACALLLLSVPLWAHSHATVDEVVTDIESRERYLERVDREPPSFVLWDADGRQVSLADFAGRVVVLNFIYARCRDVCPLHSVLLATAQRQLREAELVEGVQFVTIATDTEEAKSTAALMRQYGAVHELEGTNWAFLHGGPSAPGTTMRLAERYGLKFTPTAEGAQMHGVVTHVIDHDGRMRARFHGLRFAPENLVALVTTMMHEGPGPAQAQADASQPVAASLHDWTPIAAAGASAVIGIYAYAVRLRRRRRS